MFTCTSTSNAKITDKVITYEECPMQHEDFEADNGIFTCAKSGLYNFEFSSLLKSQENERVRVKMMLRDKFGEYPVMERGVGLHRSRTGKSVSLDVGVSNTIVYPVKMKGGDKLMFEVESDNGAGSGILNSDSRILRVSAYDLDLQTDLASCSLKADSNGELMIDHCDLSQGFDSEGSRFIDIPKAAYYKVSMGADALVGGDSDMVTVALMDTKGGIVGEATAKSKLIDDEAVIEIPIGFSTIVKIDANERLTPTLKSSGKNSINRAFIALERLSDDMKYVQCTNDGVIDAKVATYADCKGNLKGHIEPEKGIFVAPEAGTYEISFNGHLMSSGGRRVWSTLYKNAADESDEDKVIAGASFVGMFAEDTNSKERINADLEATTAMVSIESLKKGDRVWVGLGRWSAKNRMEKIAFNVRKM